MNRICLRRFLNAFTWLFCFFFTLCLFVPNISAQDNTAGKNNLRKNPAEIKAEIQNKFSKGFVLDARKSSRTIYQWSSNGINRSASPTGRYWCVIADIDNPQSIELLASKGQFEVLSVSRLENTIVYEIKPLSNIDITVNVLSCHPQFLNITPILIEEKISPALWEKHTNNTSVQPRQKNQSITVKIVFTDTLASTRIDGIINKFQLQSLQGMAPSSDNEMIANVPFAILLKLAALPEVESIDEYIAPQPCIDIARTRAKIAIIQNPQLDTVTYPPTINWNSNGLYTGEGVFVGICDRGVDKNHRDFMEQVNGLYALRMAPRIPNTTNKGSFNWVDYNPADTNSFHGSYVASVLLGNGYNSESVGGNRYQYRGVAPKAQFWACITGNRNSYDVNNHSYTGYFIYSSDDKVRDDTLSDHRMNIVGRNNIGVYAAGNNGFYSEPCIGGYVGASQIGFFSLINVNKNGIIVGATSKLTGKRMALSSMGPTRDGRVGIDVMAPGGGAAIKVTCEIDYLRVGNSSGTIKQWDFNDNAPMWGESNRYLTHNRRLQGGSFYFDVDYGGSVNSEILNPTITTTATDVSIR